MILSTEEFYIFNNTNDLTFSVSVDDLGRVIIDFGGTVFKKYYHIPTASSATGYEEFEPNVKWKVLDIEGKYGLILTEEDRDKIWREK